jgi:NADPH-dependent 2,4-dienoyl-CoA reductase/sulfur reductase-like enzyme
MSEQLASLQQGAKTKEKRVLVLGGGPIGVELACRAAADGWSVTLVEQGCPLAHVRAWGHVTLFSPWGNITLLPLISLFIASSR